MGRKFPYIQLYVDDFLRDTEPLSDVATAVWTRAFIRMHIDDRCGILTGSIADVARLCRTTEEVLRACLDEFRRFKTCNFKLENGIVTLENRRMRREFKERKSTYLRVKKHREKNGNENSPTLKRRNAQNLTTQELELELELELKRTTYVPPNSKPPEQPPPASSSPKSAENPGEKSIADSQILDDNDELGSWIRAFIGGNKSLLYDLKSDRKMRELVGIVGREQAAALVQQGIDQSVDWPIGWALGKAQGMAQRTSRQQAINDGKESTEQRMRRIAGATK